MISKTIIIGAGKPQVAHTRPALCLDLDGTIRGSKSGKDFISGPDDILLLPNVERKILEYYTAGWIIFGVSNQGGVAYGLKTPDDVNKELDAMISLFQHPYEGGSPFASIFCCFHHPQGTVFPYNTRSMFRKPGIGMLAEAEAVAYSNGVIIDWSSSLFVGDREEDMQCARNAMIEFRWSEDFFDRRVGVGA